MKPELKQCAPLFWLYEDQLPDGYPYDAMYPYSKVDGVRLFPVFVPVPATDGSAGDAQPTQGGKQCS